MPFSQSSHQVLSHEWDVIVLGSGIAGSAAAVAAARAGASVLMAEKLGSYGGSSALSAGLFWTAPTLESYQARIPRGDTGLAMALIETYPHALRQIRETGIAVTTEPKHDVMTFGIGYRIDIGALLDWSRRELESLGGAVVHSLGARRLIVEADRVVGATLSDPSGVTYDVRASAVVLATGGFQGDPAEMNIHVGSHSENLLLRSNPGSVGDGLRLARTAGASGTKGMSTFYGHLVPTPLTQFTPADYLPLAQFYSSKTLLLNRAGERIFDETQGDELLNQVLARQPGGTGVLIFDQEVREQDAIQEPEPGLGAVDRIAAAVTAGARYASAPTIADLVAKISTWGIDGARAARTFQHYQEAIATGTGICDGIGIGSTARVPRTPPFHALMVQPTVTFTLGGVRVDRHGHVLDRDGRPVPGLFAAGADIGGISNFGYAGGLAPGYITGLWAGTSAAGPSGFTGQASAAKT